MTLRLVLVLALTSPLIPAAKVWAQQSQEDASRQHYEAGQLLVRQRRFQDAYREFELGYSANPRPAFLFNMAECARESGNLTQARLDYTRYLDAAPRGSQASLARERLADLGPEPVAPAIPVAPVSPPPPPTAPPTPPEVNPPEPEPAEPEIRLVPTPPEPTDGPEFYEDWPFWTILGVVVVGAAVGVGVGVAASEGANPCGPGCVTVNWRM